VQWLFSASVIWGFSFGLIKGMTTGVDPFVLGFCRSMVAALVFLPWIWSSHRVGKSRQDIIWAFVCGFVQIGLMYGPYLKSFQYLKAHEVALFTMTTPLIAGLMLRASERQALARLLTAILLATLGGVIAAWQHITSETWLKGVLLVQASNTLFALGSLLWMRRFKAESARSLRAQARLMTPYFIGGAAASALLTWIFASNIVPLSQSHAAAILWLGVMASGAGFFMWNRGVALVSPASLAAANNLKIPLAILISITIFGESANLWPLLIGISFIFLALRVADGKPQTKLPH
jgi:drug/metabolite transporter (DMT)-like permease